MSKKWILLFSLFLTACTSGNQEEIERNDDEATRIVQEAIETHGGELYNNTRISFKFRNRIYSATRNGGLYTYSREFKDSLGNIKDVLDNDGLTRYLDGNQVGLDNELTSRYSQSVNSVLYFALLPFPLSDPAVNLDYIGAESISTKDYDVIRVTFDQQGGGEDHSDVFMYWFDKEDRSMDFLAYKYETEGGGLRFRKATGRKEVNGLAFYDFDNYKPVDDNTPLEKLPALYEEGKLIKVSEIILEDIEVDINNQGA